ncbi:CocE/NonD family hydrolase [Streptomyces broussonetiae]|uniref:CocE/NonD family hydrolase n=1 Tax=Streptomyces broussonetiae TaxID=2686304 RepID=UPI0018EEE4A5|nr:CocE/NonD family hydrolase [Streptomyces broussonetiae]
MVVMVEEDVPATMRDGTVLRADGYRPGTGGPCRVLLSRLPHGKSVPVMTGLLEHWSPTWTSRPPAGTGNFRGALLMSGEFRAGPLDQARVEARPDVLVYTSEPLAEDLEVTGRVRALLHAVTDAPSTDWVVRLCDVGPDGVSRNVVDGTVRPDTTPGEFTEHAVDLWSTSYVFRAGHRLRVHVTSSNFPRWDRNPNTGEPLDRGTNGRPARQEIAHDAVRSSRIVLPVVRP